MICDKCGYQLGKDALYCPQCGNNTQNAITDNRNNQHCPKCGNLLDDMDDFCGECGFNIKNDENSSIAVHSEKPSKMLLISLVLTIVLLSAIVVCSLISQNEKEKLTKINSNFNQETTHISEKSKENSDKDEEEFNDKDSLQADAPDKNYTDYEVEEPKHSSFGKNENVYSFRSGEQNLITEPTYVTVSDSQYSYYCHVPSHFVKDDTSDHITYYSPDKTAVMEIIAFNNSSNKSVADVMNSYIASIGGEVTYSASGESWFAASIKKDDVAYYIKGFVDEYIREFTFDFPIEYLDIYDDYINHIEDNFKRTDK